MFTEAQLARSIEVTREAVVRKFFIQAFVKLNFECVVNRLKMTRSSQRKGSLYQHQKLGIVCEVFDERLAGWSSVLGIVTEDLL